MRESLEDWVRKYCNDDFEDGFPAGVELFFDKAEDYLVKVNGITSESLGDYSVSVSQELPSAITSILSPYRRLKII